MSEKFFKFQYRVLNEGEEMGTGEVFVAAETQAVATEVGERFVREYSPLWHDGLHYKSLDGALVEIHGIDASEPAWFWRLKGDAIVDGPAFPKEAEAPASDEQYVIYSANEAASNDAGFWSNENGWVEDLQDATPYSEADTKSLNLSMSVGRDAAWCPARNFTQVPSPR